MLNSVIITLIFSLSIMYVYNVHVFHKSSTTAARNALQDSPVEWCVWQNVFYGKQENKQWSLTAMKLTFLQFLFHRKSIKPVFGQYNEHVAIHFVFTMLFYKSFILHIST